MRAVQTLAQRTLGSIILLSAISLGTLFFRLGSLPLTGADEPRYVRISQEMKEQGRWVTPTLERRPWLEKPPLYYWITIPLLYSFGNNETAARIGPAVCALIAALAIYWLGTRVWTRKAGLLGASILLTSLGFAGYGRSASTDMPMTACLTICLAILAAAVYKEPGKTQVLCAYGFLGLAVLGKGPVAVILMAGIGLFFWLLDERGVALRRWRAGPGLIVAAAVSIPWFWLAFRQNGFAFISTFFINHNLARYVTSIHHHSQPFYYYLPVLLALFFPWSGWLLLLIPKSPIKGLNRWRFWHPAKLFLVCWVLFPLFFFSLSDSKLAGYVLPSLPPLALLLGVRLSRLSEEAVGHSRLWATVGMYLAFSTAMAIAAPIYFQTEYGGTWKIGLILSAAIWGPSLFAFGFGIKGNWRLACGATLLQGVLIVTAAAQFAFPVLGTYYSTREIAHRTLELRQAGEPIATYIFFQHSFFYYTGYQFVHEFNNLESMRRFAESNRNFLVVTSYPGMKEILSLSGFSASLLSEQGDFRLLRISPNKGSPGLSH